MPLAAGDQLSHYRVTNALGAGGMGEVYRATDTKLEAHGGVAVQVVLGWMAEVQARLRSPNAYLAVDQ